MGMRLTCTRKIGFDAGHRVCGHESKCAHLHGHRYTVLLTATADQDELGRIIDFGVLKALVGDWIDHYWDHGMLLWEHDPLRRLIEAFNVGGEGTDDPQKVYTMPENPTAENIAKYLLEHVCPDVLADTGVEVTHVRVWETPNCYADAGWLPGGS